jgi:hypothetical protein
VYVLFVWVCELHDSVGQWSRSTQNNNYLSICVYVLFVWVCELHDSVGQWSRAHKIKTIYQFVCKFYLCEFVSCMIVLGNDLGAHKITTIYQFVCMFYLCDFVDCQIVLSTDLETNDKLFTNLCASFICVIFLVAIMVDIDLGAHNKLSWIHWICSMITSFVSTQICY